MSSCIVGPVSLIIEEVGEGLLVLEKEEKKCCKILVCPAKLYSMVGRGRAMDWAIAA